jgi:hypothetical protein
MLFSLFTLFGGVFKITASKAVLNGFGTLCQLSAIKCAACKRSVSLAVDDNTFS